MHFSSWGPLISMSIDGRRADGKVFLWNRGGQKSLLHDIFCKEIITCLFKVRAIFYYYLFVPFFVLSYLNGKQLYEKLETTLWLMVSHLSRLPRDQLGLHKSPGPPTDQPKEEINFLEYYAESASYVLGFARFIQVLEFDTCTIPCSLVYLHDFSIKENYFEKHFHLARYIMVLWRICF